MAKLGHVPIIAPWHAAARPGLAHLLGSLLGSAQADPYMPSPEKGRSAQGTHAAGARTRKSVCGRRGVLVAGAPQGKRWGFQERTATPRSSLVAGGRVHCGGACVCVRVRVRVRVCVCARSTPGREMGHRMSHPRTGTPEQAAHGWVSGSWPMPGALVRLRVPPLWGGPAQPESIACLDSHPVLLSKQRPPCPRAPGVFTGRKKNKTNTPGEECGRAGAGVPKPSASRIVQEPGGGRGGG